MNLMQILRLSKTIQKFAEVETAQGILICNGELAEGVEVFVEQDGDVIPAPDGEYETEDKVIVVTEGKVAEMKDKETTPAEDPEKPAEEQVTEQQEDETPANENEQEPEKPAEDDKDAKIAELEAKIAELEAKIAELEAENAELSNKLGEAKEELSKPVHTETKLEKQNTTFKTYFKK